MSNIFVVGYDDSDTARRALDFAVSRAKAQGGEIIVAHVLEWSPYSFLSPTELEERHKRRQQELERAESAILAPVLKDLEKSGVKATGAMRYGQIADTICAIARDEKADQIIVGRHGEGGLAQRVFGSVAGTLTQIAPVPCTIVP
ncbi:universal stress protein [Aquicoccus porphyridii]|uniref:Universal stress protein n=1 Tax=Aquicoccus porphyridii TaxID=1852029 RepID=A0A5A9Z4T0_9RHOB|nr:universal stress protein [Aquicoccus porphyridii]KAA0912144.1 universal stress protein [Aquicoccus porphyridii]RAI53003.1 universal stress protein [Rhodobacteraceae bacterium AsT-22]